MKKGLFLVALAACSLLACTQTTSNISKIAGSTWPDLTTIRDYPNPWGTECGPEGKSREGGTLTGDKAKGNRLKNRFRLPENFEKMSFDEFLKLPGYQTGFLENKGVELVAYVKDLHRGGTKGETANCGANRPDQVDIHINLVDDPNNQSYSGKGLIVAEVTERTRRLGKGGFLKFSTPRGETQDWAYQSLRDRLVGRWVRVKGWLFFDRDHVHEDWGTDPADNKGNANWRGHSWEIHPLMEIEVLNGKPK
jgi:hypothetical protein